ncbi:MAG: hypothetical protein ACHQAX_09680, partial [Gammaproteobacteria bacterium]
MRRFFNVFVFISLCIALSARADESNSLTAVCSNFEAFNTDYITEKKQPDDKPTLKKFDDKKTKLLSKELVVLWQPGNNKAKFKFKE